MLAENTRPYRGTLRKHARPDLFCTCTSLSLPPMYAEIIDVSTSGVRLRFNELDARRLASNAPLRLQLSGLTLHGRVRWLSDRCAGIQLEHDAGAGSMSAIHRFIAITA